MVLVQHWFVALWLAVLQVTCKESLVAAVKNVYLRILELWVDVYGSVMVTQKPHTKNYKYEQDLTDFYYVQGICIEATLQHKQIKF